MLGKNTEMDPGKYRIGWLQDSWKYQSFEIDTWLPTESFLWIVVLFSYFLENIGNILEYSMWDSGVLPVETCVRSVTEI